MPVKLKNVGLGLPNCGSRPLVTSALPVRNCVFVTLKVSQRIVSLCFSLQGIPQLLEMPVANGKKCIPRRMFRAPVSPGAGLRKLLYAAAGSENRFGR